MSSLFCDTMGRCPTLYIISNVAINELLIPNYKETALSDNLIRQILTFLQKYKTINTNKFWVCVKGSELIEFDGNIDVTITQLKIKNPKPNDLVKLIFDEQKEGDTIKEFLSENVNIKLKLHKDYNYLYKVKLVGSKSGSGGSIKELMLKKVSLYLKPGEKVTSMICTFNQGEAKSNHEEEIKRNLSRILKLNEPDANLPHLVAFGLQECSYDVLPRLMKEKYHRIGSGALTQNLISTQFGSIGLGFMYLHIFVKKMSKSPGDTEITIESMDASTDTCGNPKKEKKGSIVIPIKMTCNGLSTIINFVNVHLPSAPKKIEERNACLIRSTIKLADTTFVFGDMNYRTSDIKEVPEDEQKKLAINPLKCGCLTDASNNEFINEKLKSEQLLEQLKTIIKDFKESPITFCPSCRFKEHFNLEINNDSRCKTVDLLNLYDTKRYPSWCDRILYKIKENPNFNITIDEDSYNSDHVTMKSDHALVFLKFSIDIGITSGGYYEKYLKYKLKYLNLKKNINLIQKN